MNNEALVFVNRGMRPIYYMPKSTAIYKANTFIYYREMVPELPKYERNRIIAPYTEDDDRARRYKYFLYEEVK